MKRNVLVKFIGIIVLFMLFLDFIPTSLSAKNAYANEISYTELYGVNPSKTSLKWYRQNSITVTPKKNPKFFKFNKKINAYVPNIAGIPLDGRIYRFVDQNTGREIFYKVISLKASAKKRNVYEIEVQRAIYDGSKFIIDNKSIIFEEKSPVQYMYLKLLGKVGTADKPAPTPEQGDLDYISPEEQIPDITEPEETVPEEIIEPEKIVPEAPLPEVVEPEKIVPEAPLPEVVEPEKIVPEVPLPEVIEPEKIVPEAPLSEGVEPEKIELEKDITSMIITRLGGANRIATALEIADEFRGDSKLNAVILALATNFPDALSGAPLIRKYNAPILLVNKTANNSKATLDYIIKNVNTSGQVVILGSFGVIDESITNHLKNAGFNNIKRLGGINRFGTNMAIVEDLAPAKGSEVIISSSTNFPDALSISSVSATKGIPIMLTNKNGLSSEVKSLLTSIEPTRIYITGGLGAITKNVEDQLKKYSSEVIRLSGYDRYETSIQINNYFKSDLTGDGIVLVTGLDFPDALAGISLSSKYNVPILLVNPGNPNVQKNYIENNKRKNVYVLGSTGVFSKGLLSYITQ